MQQFFPITRIWKRNAWRTYNNGHRPDQCFVPLPETSIHGLYNLRLHDRHPMRSASLSDRDQFSRCSIRPDFWQMFRYRLHIDFAFLGLPIVLQPRFQCGRLTESFRGVLGGYKGRIAGKTDVRIEKRRQSRWCWAKIMLTSSPCASSGIGNNALSNLCCLRFNTTENCEHQRYSGDAKPS